MMIRFTDAIAGRIRGERTDMDDESAALLVARGVAEYVDAPAAGDDEPVDDEDQDGAESAAAGRRPRRR